MNEEIKKQLTGLEQKIDAIYASVEQARKYFFWTMIITLIVFILPLAGLAFVVPVFLSGYTHNIVELL